MNKCENCIHADVSDSPRVIKHGNITIYQNANSVNCKCENIRSINITDGEMVCSEYRRKQKGGETE